MRQQHEQSCKHHSSDLRIYHLSLVYTIIWFGRYVFAICCIGSVEHMSSPPYLDHHPAADNGFMVRHQQLLRHTPQHLQAGHVL